MQNSGANMSASKSAYVEQNHEKITKWFDTYAIQFYLLKCPEKKKYWMFTTTTTITT